MPTGHVQFMSLAGCAVSPKPCKQSIHPLLGHLEIIKEPMPECASLTYLSARPHFQFSAKPFILAFGNLFAVSVHLWSLQKNPQNYHHQTKKEFKKPKSNVVIVCVMCLFLVVVVQIVKTLPLNRGSIIINVKYECILNYSVSSFWHFHN